MIPQQRRLSRKIACSDTIDEDEGYSVSPDDYNSRQHSSKGVIENERNVARRMGAIVSHEIAAHSRAEVLTSPLTLSTQTSSASTFAEDDKEEQYLSQRQQPDGHASYSLPRPSSPVRFDIAYRNALTLAAAAVRRENAARRQSARLVPTNKLADCTTASSESSQASASSKSTDRSAAILAAQEPLGFTPPPTSSSDDEDENSVADEYNMQLKPFPHQVGGHAALLTVQQNSDIVCKPLISRELDFYRNPPESLVSFLAKFRGIYDVKITSTSYDGNVQFLAKPAEDAEPLRFAEQNQACRKRKTDRAMSIVPVMERTTRHQQGVNKTAAAAVDRNILLNENDVESDFHSTKAWSVSCLNETVQKFRAQQQATQQFLALKNVIGQYRRPCIIDLKMGIQQYGDDATAAKKRSQTLKSSATTSVTLGVRACGMQVYRYDIGRYVTCDKYLGRKLGNAAFERLLHGFLFNGFRFLRRQLISEIIGKLRQLYGLISQLDGYRFFSSSLLIMYEGYADDDGTVVSDDNQKVLADKKRRFSACSAPVEIKHIINKIDVKMIDFAHTTTPDNNLVVHIGPDTGYLFGLNNLIRIFQTLCDELVE